MASPKNRRTPLFGALSLLITLGILLAGLWPFDINPVNKVVWLKDVNGTLTLGSSPVPRVCPTPHGR
jgi:hypothetical protein